MFLILVSLLVAAEAAKLDNTYLPPAGAKESGGHDGDLQVPLEPPYIDQYTPHHQKAKLRPQYRPLTRGLGLGVGKPTKPVKNEQMLENEDEIVVPTPMLGQGKFISGSYSYTGPDNVLVTVTYKADDSKDNKDEVNAVANDEEQDQPDQSNYYEEEEQQLEEEEEDDTRAAAVQDEEEQQDDAAEENVIPTPASLPAELARAFEFHKRKQEREGAKTHQKPNKNKKPIHGHGLHKKKGSQQPGYNYNQQANSAENQQQHSSGSQFQQADSGNFGMKLTPSQGHQNGYHYGPQSNVYVPPTINQGYSYAKHN